MTTPFLQVAEPSRRGQLLYGCRQHQRTIGRRYSVTDASRSIHTCIWRRACVCNEQGIANVFLRWRRPYISGSILGIPSESLVLTADTSFIAHHLACFIRLGANRLLSAANVRTSCNGSRMARSDLPVDIHQLGQFGSSSGFLCVCGT